MYLERLSICLSPVTTAMIFISQSGKRSCQKQYAIIDQIIVMIHLRNDSTKP